MASSMCTHPSSERASKELLFCCPRRFIVTPVLLRPWVLAYSPGSRGKKTFIKFYPESHVLAQGCWVVQSQTHPQRTYRSLSWNLPRQTFSSPLLVGMIMNIGNNLRNDNDYTKITTTGKPNGEKNRKTKVESSQPSFSYFFPKGNSLFLCQGKIQKGIRRLVYRGRCCVLNAYNIK